MVRYSLRKTTVMELKQLIAIENEMISGISANFVKILLVIGLVFVVLKIVNKRWNNQALGNFYEKRKLPLYHIQVVASKFGGKKL